jgi:hypothetical protein
MFLSKLVYVTLLPELIFGNLSGCMMQSGQQWRPVGGCFGGSGVNEICSDRGQMKPLSKSQSGTLDDDFNNIKPWIYSDYGRVVVAPARPRGSYKPALPYLQNGFALLQIAVQEARETHATILQFSALPHVVSTGCQVYFVRTAMHQVTFCSIADISVPKPRNSLGNELSERADSNHISLRMANLLHVRLGCFHRESRPHPSSDPLCF